MIVCNQVKANCEAIAVVMMAHHGFRRFVYRTNAMMSPFVRSLDRYGTLQAEDVAVIEAAVGGRIKHLEAGTDLVRRGDKPSCAYMILEGWAYRYKILPNQRRQIIAYLLPGDLSDLNVFFLRQLDHSIASLTPLTIAELDQDVCDALLGRANPRIAKALWIKALLASAIQREWTVNLGQRSAPERIGHILCELFHRLRMIGLTEGHPCPLPLTQSDLAESTGLSLVHVNKRLRDLRSAGLITLRGKTLTIPSLMALERVSLFNSDYLDVEYDKGDIVSQRPQLIA